MLVSRATLRSTIVLEYFSGRNHILNRSTQLWMHGFHFLPVSIFSHIRIYLLAEKNLEHIDWFFLNRLIHEKGPLIPSLPCPCLANRIPPACLSKPPPSLIHPYKPSLRCLSHREWEERKGREKWVVREQEGEGEGVQEKKWKISIHLMLRSHI